MSPVRVGVVGFGSIGRHHVRNLRAMPGVALVGVADIDPRARADASHLGLATFETSEALLAVGLDAVIVSVPTSDHEAVSLPFVDASVALFVEKPLAHSLESAKRIVARCEETGVPLMVGYVERYNPAMQAVRDFVRDGGLGRLVNMSARRVGLRPPRVRDANVLVDIGVHDIDIAAFITGARLNLLAAHGGTAVSNDRLDYATLLLDAAGTIVSIEANWLTPVKVRELCITGTDGYCRVDYITQEAWFAPSQTYEPSHDYEELVRRYVSGTLLPLPVAKREPLACELDVFVAGVRGGPFPDPRIALASLRIAEEATRSIALAAARAPVARPA